jgi:DNA-binding beta-propeller fold protein YncE
VCALALALAAPAAAQPGSLSQLPDPDSCLMDLHAWSWIHCPSRADALDGAITAVVSPDGRNVYVASFLGDAVASFSRNPDTGALTPLPGAAACMQDRFADAPTQCSTIADGIDAAIGIAISPDGRNVYVAGVESDAVAVFSRDPDTGALTQLGGAGSCVKDPGPESAQVDCPQTAEGLHGVRWVSVSPDGKNVYTTAPAGHSIAAFSRDPGTGALTPLPGSAECIEDAGDNDPSSGLPLGSFKSNCQRTANGIAYPRNITISPDGRNAYTADDFGDAIAEFTRDPDTGELTQMPGADSCIRDQVNAPSYTHCPRTSGSLNGAFQVAVSPDGRNAYVAGDGADAVSAFSRDPVTGALHQLPGQGACVEEWNSPASTYCPVTGDGLVGAESVSVSPDGMNVYVAAFHGRAVAEFTRDLSTGALTQLGGPDSCMENVIAPDDTHCPTVVNGIEQPRGVAISPDGRNVYSPASVGDELAVFRRDVPPPPPPQPPVSPPPPAPAVSPPGCPPVEVSVGGAAAPRKRAPKVTARISSRRIRLVNCRGKVRVVVAATEGPLRAGRIVISPAWRAKAVSHRFKARRAGRASLTVALPRSWCSRLVRTRPQKVRLRVRVVSVPR